MEDIRISNVNTSLSGRVITKPSLVTKYGNVKILCVTIESKRRSGKMDKFNIHYSNDLGVILTIGMYIELTGDIRTLNDKGSNKVVRPFVMAKTVKILPEEPEEYLNTTEIVDAELLEFGEIRSSYSDESKMLATYRIRVNRRHDRFGIFDVTTWGRDAIFLGNIHDQIKYMHLKGRLQSYFSKANDCLYFGYTTFFVEIEDKPSEDNADDNQQVEPIAD